MPRSRAILRIDGAAGGGAPLLGSYPVSPPLVGRSSLPCSSATSDCEFVPGGRPLSASSLLRRCRLGVGGVVLGGDRDEQLADGDFHAFFDVNLADGARRRGRDGAYGLLGFQFDERLVFFDFLAFADQNTDDGS